MSIQFSPDTFEGHVHTSFEVTTERYETVRLVLAEIQDKTPPSFEGSQFSLMFKGPVEQPLSQRIYQLVHAELGRFDLFLVPIGRNGGSVIYEAFFNIAGR